MKGTQKRVESSERKIIFAFWIKSKVSERVGIVFSISEIYSDDNCYLKDRNKEIIQCRYDQMLMINLRYMLRLHS